MHKITAVLVLFLIAFFAIEAKSIDKKDVYSMLHPVFRSKVADNKGVPCAACVIVIRVVENLAKYQEPSVEKALEKFCDLLPDQARAPCHTFVALFGGVIVDMLIKKQNPDTICHELTLCNSQCKLFPTSNKASEPLSYNASAEKQMFFKKLRDWWHDFIQRIVAVFDTHKPLYDFDNDMHATTYALRGSAWRGKDCDDNNANIYAGRKKSFYGNDVDHNCNGIAGTSPSGKSYEDELCNQVQRGVAILGDSACAHFRIPEQWVLPQDLHEKTFKPLLEVAELEMDWPQLSWVTGYQNDTTGLTPGPVSSIYMKLKERNRCVHRDFQNICVNGARTGAMKDIVKSYQRNQTSDHPAIVFYALVGNDVCTPHPTIDRFTKPEEFYNNVVAALDYLDTVLPNNSHVIFIGLADGGILYDTLHNLTHPLGVDYKHVYDFLNCLEINPCWGWMNSNETVRHLTSQHAKLLSSQYPKIIADKKYAHFDMLYYDFPIGDIIKKLPVEPKDLIEPMDGFHPSQLANYYIASFIWQDLETNHPEIIGPINPNNAKIDQIFGNQGGY